MPGLNELLQRAAESIQGGRAFGPAFEHQGTYVIPVAYVFGGGGGGEDNRPRKDAVVADAVAPAGSSPPNSGGGGFGFVSWPVGAYVVKNGEVTWRPAIDVGLVIVLTGGVLKGLARIRSKRKAIRA